MKLLGTYEILWMDGVFSKTLDSSVTVVDHVGRYLTLRFQAGCGQVEREFEWDSRNYLFRQIHPRAE